MKAFLSSLGGRLAQGATGLALIGGGAAAVFAGSPSSYAILTLSTIAAVAISVVALGIASMDHPKEAVMALVTAPFALFAFHLLNELALNYSPLWGYAFCGLGAVFLISPVVLPAVLTHQHSAN